METNMQKEARQRVERLALKRANIDKPEHDMKAFAAAMDAVLTENPELYTKAMDGRPERMGGVTAAERTAKRGQQDGESFAEALDRTLHEAPDLYGVPFRGVE